MIAETFSRKYYCPACKAIHVKSMQMLLLSEAFEKKAVVISDASEYVVCENCGGKISMESIVTGRLDHRTAEEKKEMKMGTYALIGMIISITALIVFSGMPWLACIWVGMIVGVIPGALLFQTSKLLKFFLVIVALGIVSVSGAQTSYTTFLENNEKISWAAEYRTVVNLTPVTNTVSLKKYFLERIKKQGLMSYVLSDHVRTDSSMVRIPDLQRQEWLKDFYVRASDNPERWEFRSKKALSGYRISGFSMEACCGCDEANAFGVNQFVNQLLIYAAGKFSTRNIFLSPLCLRQTGEERAAWYSLGNFAWNTSPSKPAAATYLTRSAVTYAIDPHDSSYQLDILTLGDDMLMNHLLADVKAGKVTAHDVETEKRIPYQDLLTWKMPYDTSAVYDDSFEVASYVVTQRVLDPSDFSHIRLEQDWYYDFKTDRLFSEIRSGTLLLQRRLPDGRVIGFQPFVRLKFK
jgi:hypothetical protein